MITIFQGTLGSGKSASMVVDMVEHLQNGGVVAANFNLVPDWAERLAGGSLRARLGLTNAKKVAASYRDRFRVVHTLDDVWKASDDLIPHAIAPVSSQREGRGRLYLDECQLIFNSRQWGDNSGWIHFFSQSRKLKWDIVLVAHSVNMIDKQIRPFLEYETRFRDLRKIKFLGLVPLAPQCFPMFLAITRYAGISAGAGEVAHRRVYPLVPRLASLYDSAFVFGRKDSPSEEQEQPGVPERSEAVAGLLPAQFWNASFPKKTFRPRQLGACTSLY